MKTFPLRARHLYCSASVDDIFLNRFHEAKEDFFVDDGLRKIATDADSEFWLGITANQATLLFSGSSIQDIFSPMNFMN